jgi:hypothetical protein
LAGQRHSRAADFERNSIRRVLRQQWPLVWPGGLAITNPDIPNRKLVLFEPGRGPLELAGALQRGTALSKQDTANAATVPLHLEPLNPRAPLAIWRAADVDNARLDEIVAGLASFLSPRDIADLHGLLTSRQSAPPAQTLVSACELSQVGGAGSAEEAVGLRKRVAPGCFLEFERRARQRRDARQRYAAPPGFTRRRSLARPHAVGDCANHSRETPAIAH